MSLNWNPYNESVQGGIPLGDHTSGMNVLIAAGPPLLKNLGGPAAIGGGQDVVYPIGGTQNIAMGQNKQWSRIFEIGSRRSVFLPGHAVGQLTLSRVYYNGPSILRALYAYYSDLGGEFPDVESLLDTSFLDLETPFINGPPENGLPRRKGGLHDVKLPPGFGNLFLNLASDLFSQPIGLFLLFRTAEEQNLAALYLEQCVVPSHNFAFDSQGLIVQESVGIQYENMIPLQTNQIATLRGIHPGNNPTSLVQTQQASV
jgi:hypothetical protein